MKDVWKRNAKTPTASLSIASLLSSYLSSGPSFILFHSTSSQSPISYFAGDWKRWRKRSWKISSIFHGAPTKQVSYKGKGAPGRMETTVDSTAANIQTHLGKDVWVWKQLSVKSTEERIHYGSTVFISQEFTSVEPGFSYKIGRFFLRDTWFLPAISCLRARWKRREDTTIKSHLC